MSNIVVIGGSGAIGSSFVEKLSISFDKASIFAFSSNKSLRSSQSITYNYINYRNEYSIEKAALIASEKSPVDLVIIATGILHYGEIMPEKSLRDLSLEKFHLLFEANTILPALIMKHFIPRLNRRAKSVFAALSARVGSISDNKLGGWYSYRASKSALNMVIKNAAIETSRNNKNAVIVGLHPGTVDSQLSKPFQSNVPEKKLFTPDYSAKKMLEVLEKLAPKDTGKCFDWDGKEVAP